MSVVLVIKANVASYDHCRNSYEDAVHFRRENGVLHDEVYRSPEDMTSILMLQTFDSVESARAFVAIPKCAEMMKAACHRRVTHFDRPIDLGSRSSDAWPTSDRNVTSSRRRVQARRHLTSNQ